MFDVQTVSGGKPAGKGFVPGLEGVVAAQTRLSHVDGEAGRLIIGGYPVEELAARASFEDVVYLLWKDGLPDTRVLAALPPAPVVQWHRLPRLRFA